MQFRGALTALAAAVASFYVSAALKLRSPPVVAEQASEVAALHQKLEHIADALDSMLSPEAKGSLAKAQVAPSMRMFLKELRTTLEETAHPKNATSALERLQATKASVADLTKALTKQQESLMHQGEAEEASLLLGVLMTRRGEPLAKQLEVLRDPQFEHLAVTKELLSRPALQPPLFKQVALWMDSHGGGGGPPTQDAKREQMKRTITYFQGRVDVLERALSQMEEAHKTADRRFLEVIKGNMSKASAHRLELFKKKADRDYRKRFAVQQQQLQTMREIVTALQHGDVKTLQRAQGALKASMRAMEQQTGNFLHLLQLGHRLEQRDCPYCAAQCIDKCHSAGKPYVMCLTQCADAGA